jgi:hypothetical protein
MFGAISRPRLGACQRSWARVRRRRTGAPRIRMIAPSRHPPTADAGAAGAREVCSIAPLPTRATSMSATLLHPHRFDGTRVTSNCGRLLRTTSSAPSETGSRPSRLIETGSMPPRQSLRGRRRQVTQAIRHALHATRCAFHGSCSQIRLAARGRQPVPHRWRSGAPSRTRASRRSAAPSLAGTRVTRRDPDQGRRCAASHFPWMWPGVRRRRRREPVLPRVGQSERARRIGRSPASAALLCSRSRERGDDDHRTRLTSRTTIVKHAPNAGRHPRSEIRLNYGHGHSVSPRRRCGSEASSLDSRQPWKRKPCTYSTDVLDSRFHADPYR